MTGFEKWLEVAKERADDDIARQALRMLEAAVDALKYTPQITLTGHSGSAIALKQIDQIAKEK